MWLLGRDRFTRLDLLNFIRNDSPEDHKNYLRMSDENVQYLITDKHQHTHFFTFRTVLV